MYSRDCNLTPANQVIKMKWSRAGEHIAGDFGVNKNALDEHPEDGGLEAEYKHSLHGAAEEGVVLV